MNLKNKRVRFWGTSIFPIHMIPLAEKRWNCLNSISKLWVFREFFCLHVCNCFVQPTDFQNTLFRTHVFRKIRSSGTQLFLHLMRYFPSSVKTKSAYISSGLRPVKLVVTGFRLCPDAKREFCSSLYVPYLNSFSA